MIMIRRKHHKSHHHDKEKHHKSHHHDKSHKSKFPDPIRVKQPGSIFGPPKDANDITRMLSEPVDREIDGGSFQISTPKKPKDSASVTPKRKRTRTDGMLPLKNSTNLVLIFISKKRNTPEKWNMCCINCYICVVKEM